MQGASIRQRLAAEVKPSVQVGKGGRLRSLVGFVLADELLNFLSHELAHRRRSSGGEHFRLGDDLLVELDGQVPLHDLDQTLAGRRRATFSKKTNRKTKKTGAQTM